MGEGKEMEKEGEKVSHMVSMELIRLQVVAVEELTKFWKIVDLMYLRFLGVMFKILGVG